MFFTAGVFYVRKDEPAEEAQKGLLFAEGADGSVGPALFFLPVVFLEEV